MSKESVVGAPPPTSPRLSDCDRWDSSAWRQLRTVVVGLGKSGLSAARVLVDRDCRVIVVDEQDDPKDRKIAQELKSIGVEDVILGGEALRALPDFSGAGDAVELIITSPAVPADHRFFRLAAVRKIPVWSDIELAWRLRRRQGRKTPEWICITGTNGKTTTTSLVKSMLSESLVGQKPLRAIAVGNIGTPILETVGGSDEYDYFVVELSSFQLHWTYSISPAASVCLNIAEDHLEWHGSYQNYSADKAKIYRSTRIACIYNEEATETKAMVEAAETKGGCRAVGFTLETPGRGMLGIADGAIVDRAFADEGNTARKLVTLSQLQKLLGRAPAHMVANILAAAALTRSVGVPEAAVAAGVAAYRPGAHRMEFVKNYAGVDYIDDSKATNPHAALASLRCFKSVVWIAGGLSKGVEYAELVKDVMPLLKGVVVIGEEQRPILRALEAGANAVARTVVSPYVEGEQSVAPLGRKQENSWQPVKKTGREVMRQAVEAAQAMAVAGDVVLLAPAAASMDQFVSYDDRGKEFALAVVNDLGEEKEVRSTW